MRLLGGSCDDSDDSDEFGSWCVGRFDPQDLLMARADDAKGEDGSALAFPLDLVPKMGAIVVDLFFCVVPGVVRADGPGSLHPLSRWTFIRCSGTSWEQIGLVECERTSSQQIPRDIP